MAQNSTHMKLRISVLTAALLGVYGVAGAAPGFPDLHDGQHHEIPGPDYAGTEYSRIIVRDGSSLDASGLTIDGAVSGKQGAIRVLFGSTVNISDSTIENHTTSPSTHGFGLQAASRARSSDDGLTSIIGSDLTIATAGVNGVGVQVYMDGGSGEDQGDVYIELTGSDTNTITTSGTNGWGIQAVGTSRNGEDAAAEGTATVVTHGTVIKTTGDYGFGAFADERGARIELNDGSITTAGTATGGGGKYGSIGVLAKNGGSVGINGTSITTSGDYADGLRAEVGGTADTDNAIATRIDGTSVKVTTTGDHAHAAHAMGGNIKLIGGSLSTSGAQAHGAYADGLDSSIITEGVTIKAAATASDTGGMAFGVFADNDAAIKLTGGSISTTGEGYARAILAEDGATVTTTGVAISTAGSDSHAVQATRGGAAIITGGAINTDKDRSWGFNVYKAQVTSSANVTTKGANSFGAFVEGDGGKFTQEGGFITTEGGPGTDGSFGVLAKLGGSAVLRDTTITTGGDLAEGVRAEGEAVNPLGRAASTIPTVTAEDTRIRTSGKKAHGVAIYEGEDLTRGSVSVNGGTITTTGAGSAGVFLKNNSEVTLDGVKVVSAGSSLQSSLTKNAVQKITVKGGSDLRVNNGTLLEVNRSGGGASGTITLDLQDANTFVAGNVLDLDLQGEDSGETIVKKEGVNWAGIVVKQGDEIQEEGSKNYDQADYAGSVATGSSSTATFTNNVTIGGGISTGVGSTTQFQGTSTIAGNVAGQQNSITNFAGAANIGGSAVGVQGSRFTFSGDATIGSDTSGTSLAGEGSTFSFSQTGSTNIDGNVILTTGTSGSTLSGGSMSNPIQIAGNTEVDSGSTLGGNLFVAGALKGAGRVSPGNSIGTISVATAADFSGDFDIEVNAAGEADLVIVRDGNIDLEGKNLTVRPLANANDYALNHDYTILQTETGVVTNEFDSVDDSGFGTSLVGVSTAYADQDVKIRLSVDSDKVAAKRAGLSRNQNATLDGVLSVAGNNASADAALLSTDTGNALNQLSGEVHASTQSALLNNSSLITRTLTNRMRSNLGAGMQAGAPTAQASGAVAGSMPTSNAYPLWAEVVGSWNTLDDNGNAAKAKSNVAGLFIGGDAAVGNGWRVGGALGFTDGKIEVDDRSSKSDVTSYTAALYGGNSWAASNGKVNFLAGAAYTRNSVDSRRTVTVSGNQTLKADYDVNTTQLFTELGYAMPVGQASEVEPYLGVAWLSQKAKGFTESGGSAALRGDSQTDDVTTFTLGLRGKTAVDVGANQASLFAGLGWRHASGDVEAERRLGFVQGNGATFKVAGAPIAKNAAVVDVGAEMAVGKSAAMGLGYSGQFGNGNTDSTGSLYLKVKF